MKKFKRLGLLLSLIGMTLILLAGCGSNQNTASTAAQKSQSKSGKLISFYLDRSDWNAGVNQVGQMMLDKYGMGMKAVGYSDTTSYQATVRTSLRTNQAPPMFKWWSGYQMKGLVESGLVADLTSEWQNQYEKEGVSADIAKAFTINGKIYGAPLETSFWVMYYNKHLFSQYNLQPPKTWEEFTHICDVLKSHGVAPIAQTVTGQWPGFIWFEQLLATTDPSLYDQLMQGKVAYTDPRVAKVMQVWADMEKKGYFGTPEDWQNNIPSDMAKGKVGMVLFGQWYASSLNGAGMKPGKDYGAFVLPSVNSSAGNVVIFETAPIMVAANSPDKQDAIKALNAFMQTDMQQKWGDIEGFAPDVNGVTSTDSNITDVQKQIESGKYRLVQRFWEATPPAIAQFAANEFDKFILNPGSYNSELQAIQDYAQQQWKTNPSGS